MWGGRRIWDARCGRMETSVEVSTGLIKMGLVSRRAGHVVPGEGTASGSHLSCVESTRGQDPVHEETLGIGAVESHSRQRLILGPRGPGRPWASAPSALQSHGRFCTVAGLGVAKGLRVAFARPGGGVQRWKPSAPFRAYCKISILVASQQQRPGGGEVTEVGVGRGRCL